MILFFFIVYHDIKGYAVTFPDDSTKFFVERIDQFSPYVSIPILMEKLDGNRWIL